MTAVSIFSAEPDPFAFRISVGLRSVDGKVRWLRPGVPERSGETDSLEFEALADRDCWLYAILFPEGGGAANVLWPPVPSREAKKVRAGRTLRVPFGSGRVPAGAEGTLSVLIFTELPVELHAAISEGKADTGRVRRIVRRIFQENSVFLDPNSASFELVVGSVRGAEAISGLDVRVGTFWGGTYEWMPGADS